jgi:stage II sporulation SpoAA-like protein
LYDQLNAVDHLEEPPMIELIEDLPRNVVGIAVKGRVTKQDCDDVLTPAMEKSLKRHDKIRLYYELNSRFPGAAWDDLDLGIEHVSRCERVAIVTDVGWVRLTVKALRFLIPSEIRVFATIQAPEGRAWITANPGSRTSTEGAAPVRPRLTRSRRARRSSSPGRASGLRRDNGRIAPENSTLHA